MIWVSYFWMGNLIRYILKAGWVGGDFRVVGETVGLRYRGIVKGV